MLRPETIFIREVGPRDGFQMEKDWIPTEQKIALIDKLSNTGVYGVQITSFVPPKWVSQFKDAAEVAKNINRHPGVKYIALIPNLKGLDRAIDCNVDEVTLPSAVTETFARKNLNRSVAECIKTVEDVVKAAPPNLVTSASISMCFGCPYEGIVPVEQVLDVCERLAATGAPILTLGDTSGMGNPALVHEIFGRLRERCPSVRLAAHFHNTRGMGLANALAAWEEGVEIFDGSIGGLGGCPYAPDATGNIATEDLVNMFHAMGVSTGVDLEALIACSLLAEKILGRKLLGQVTRAGAWPPPKAGGVLNAGCSQGPTFFNQKRTLDCFFRPRSIAIIGASRTPGRLGYNLVQNLKKTFSGSIYPINPQAGEVAGIQAYSTVLDIPGEVDMAVGLIPAEQIPEAVKQCAEKGVKGVVIEAAGFAEIGPTGRALQEAMTETARRAGMRLWGPNCMGVIDTRTGVLTSYLPIEQIDAGGVTFITQSGAIAGGILLQILEEKIFSFNKVCSIGNKVDVNESDILEYIVDDPNTRVIAMYLESINDGCRFLKAAKAISRKKPIIIIKSGRTPLGVSASMSHTASLTGDERVTNVAFKEAGIIRVEDITDFLAVTKAFDRLCTRSAGRRVAVVSTTGAGGVMAADQLGLHNMTLAHFGPDTMQRLLELYPPWTPADQPLDVSPLIHKIGVNRTIQHAVSSVLQDKGVDALLLLIYGMPPTAEFDPKEIAKIVENSNKPAVVWMYGMDKFLRPWRQAFDAAGLPAMPDVRTAVRSLQALADWADYRSRPEEQPKPNSSGGPPPEVRKLLSSAQEGGKGIRTVARAFELLKASGICVARGTLANDPESAVKAAKEIGYPVAIKVADASLAHKSDIGGVRLGIATEASVAEAVLEVQRVVPQGKSKDVYIQEMVTGALEVVVGGARDPQFGPIVMCGLGGIWVEVLKDVAFRLAPIDERAAAEMIHELKAYPVLHGVRGQPARDINVLIKTIVAVGRLMAECPQLATLDINPFMLLPNGQGGLAVDAVIQVG